MNAELRQYQRYKSTGVPWIGVVPDHWGMERAKWLYQKMARPARDSDEIVTCFRDGIVTLRRNRRLDGFTNSLKEIGYQGVRRGDLVIHAMDAFAGAVGVSDSDGKSTPVYSVCTARRELDNRYYSYLIREMARAQWIMSLARGIRERSTDFRFQTFGAQTVPLPPVEEQRAIADYLDANAVKVRRFLRNRRRLIEVLNEQKQAIINRAVTRGIISNAPLKPSGIDWLGDVPTHWNPVRLGLFIDLLTGFPFKSSGFTEDVSDIRLLRGINVSPGCVRWDSTVRWSSTAFVELSAFTLKEGDIVFGMDRPVVSNGIRVAMIGSRDVPSLLLQRVARIRSREELDQLYLFLLLQDRRYADYLASIFTGISVPHISPTQISDYRVALPPIEEQQAIVEKVEKETRAVEVMKVRAEMEIRSIREYRTRLICDVVTGKVDVRHFTPTDSLSADEQINDVIDAAVMINDDELSITADVNEND